MLCSAARVLASLCSAHTLSLHHGFGALASGVMRGEEVNRPEPQKMQATSGSLLPAPPPRHALLAHAFAVWVTTWFFLVGLRA